MTKDISSKSFMLLSIAVLMIMLGLIMKTEGSVIKDVLQGVLMGAGAVMAVAGLWAFGKRK